MDKLVPQVFRCIQSASETSLGLALDEELGVESPDLLSEHRKLIADQVGLHEEDTGFFDTLHL
ncbi:hypothetical protein [Palleronia pelagia]|uniref:Uncharacterized protein n=1 Tax=Palleronia pelagia TaxID=387096 RepID=A0A1H8KAY4_9RHOB|nr:hypothetical protein [Palleronia pelagia]SEN89841.1 hypothetical protein SAMN04488011_107168 [Palleronia pelagia]